MKQIAIIFLLTSYTLSTLGIGVKQFYCCGKLRSTDLTLGLESKIKYAIGDENDACCNTTVQTYKVSDSHFASDTVEAPAKQFTTIASALPFFEFSIPAAIPGRANTIHAPPAGKIIPLNILHCIYRI
jgi:hypothetical protein